MDSSRAHDVQGARPRTGKERGEARSGPSRASRTPLQVRKIDFRGGTGVVWDCIPRERKNDPSGNAKNDPSGTLIPTAGRDFGSPETAKMTPPGR